MKKRVYSGKLSYLPVDEDESTVRSTKKDISSIEQNDHLTESPDQEMLEVLEHIDGSIDSGKIVEGTTENTTTPIDPAPCSADSVSLPDPATESAPAISDELGTSVLTKTLYGPKTDILPPFSSPVPSHWKTLDQDFFCLAIVSIPHMNSGSMGDPNLSIGSNKYSMMFIDPSTSRMDLLLAFKRTEDGSYLEMDCCNLINAKAFRLEPKTPGGLLTVDGEVIPYGSLQGQLHPGLGRVMCRKRAKKV